MATYYVDTTTGDNGDTGLTEGLAWSTLVYAESQLSAGDLVYVKASAAYDEAVTMSVSGDSSGYVTFEGYSSSPGDGGKATLNGGSSRVSAFTAGAPLSYRLFRNLIVKDYTSNGIHTNLGNYFVCFNCDFDNNGGTGFNAKDHTVVYGCTFDGNTVYGCSMDRGLVVKCEFTGNSGGGVSASEISLCVYNSVLAGNSLKSISAYSGAVLNCTIDGENASSTAGVYFNTSYYKAVINTIIYDLATGIDAGTAYGDSSVGRNNLLNSNTANYSNWPSSEQATDITDAPGFTDEANNDYTLAAGSAARNAGADASGTSSPGMDIGAHQSADAGGGGSRVIITG